MSYSRLIFIAVLVIRAFLTLVFHESDVFIFIKIKVTDRLAGDFIDICVLTSLSITHLLLPFSLYIAPEGYRSHPLRVHPS